VRALHIRKATTADLDVVECNINAVCREGIYLVSSHFTMPERWRRILAAGGELDNNLIIVAETDGLVVGHGRMFAGPGTSAHVADLGMALIAGFRDQGIGSRMIAYMLDWARQKGLRKVTLGVFASNKRAIHVYDKFGFAVEGVLAEQHCVGGQYVDEILMAKFL
jgi:RimJ/RimL family protein N-acetyltransferase